MKSNIPRILLWLTAIASFVYVLTYHPNYKVLSERKEPKPVPVIENPIEVCIGGVTYYRVGQAMAPAFTIYSRVRTCDELSITNTKPIKAV